MWHHLVHIEWLGSKSRWANDLWSKHLISLFGTAIYRRYDAFKINVIYINYNKHFTYHLIWTIINRLLTCSITITYLMIGGQWMLIEFVICESLWIRKGLQSSTRIWWSDEDEDDSRHLIRSWQEKGESWRFVVILDMS